VQYRAKEKDKKTREGHTYNGQMYVMRFNRTVAKGSSKTRLKREGMIIIIKISIGVQDSYWKFEAPLHKSEWPVLKPFHHFQLLSLHKKRWKRKRKTPSRRSKLLPNDWIPHQNNQKS
jgi:hypothetical protein